MLRAGITTVGEFHYVHNAHGSYDPNSERLAQIVIGAARQVGLRVAFLRTIYDTSKREGQRRFAEAPADAIERTRALAAAYADDPFVHVCPAPHSLHGASEDAIRQAAALAAELDTPWHIHLCEQEEDVPFARERYGKRPLEVLDGWRVLDRRTVLVHGIWLDEGERRLLAERGRGLVTNPTTNMALGDGIAALAELLAAGVPVAVGTDMNATPNAFLEMRTAELLQRVQALRMGVLATSRGADPDPQQVFATGTQHAAHLLGVDAGRVSAGRWADLITLDLSDPSLLPASCLDGPALLSVLTTTLVAETAVKDAFVGGRQVLSDGTVLGMPQAELAERVRGARAIGS
jgi:5-methylthioadenosine/S-adenosylhomocysteine deaminase